MGTKLRDVKAYLHTYEDVHRTEQYVEVTEWVNGEGVNVVTKDQMFRLTIEEVVALADALSSMNYVSFDDLDNYHG